jgi:hypothetical protein
MGEWMATIAKDPAAARSCSTAARPGDAAKDGGASGSSVS